MSGMVRPSCSMAASWAARSMPAASAETTEQPSLSNSRTKRRVRESPSREGLRGCGDRDAARRDEAQDEVRPSPVVEKLDRVGRIPQAVRVLAGAVDIDLDTDPGRSPQR